MKKRLLIFPFDLLSHYLRCIALAERYRDWEILFAHSEKYSGQVTAAGYATFPVESFDANTVMDQAARFSFDWLNNSDILRVFGSQAQAIRNYRPQLVIGDTSPTLKMAAATLSVPYVSLMNGYMSKYYTGLRAVPEIHPGHQHLQRLPPWLAEIITRLAERAAFRSVHKPFRKLRAELGLPYLHTYLDELEGDRNFICDRADLFPQKQLPASYEIIGPLMHSSSVNESAFLATLDLSKPTICVSLGSSGNWKPLSFLSGQPYAHLNIIAAGDTNTILQGSHIHHRTFVNLDQILPHCDFLVCHGGNGTIYEGLRHRKFMLCLTSHFEQEWNARRIEELGLGKRINADPAGIFADQLKQAEVMN